MQLTVGTRHFFWALLWLWSFSVSTATPPSYPPQLTLAVGQLQEDCSHDTSLQILFVIVGLCLAFWLISAMAVLLTPRPSDPWRGQPIQADGEYIRISDGAELFVRHWLPSGEARHVILALHGLGQHSGYHHRFGARVANTGRAYFALDLRGNGLTRTAHGDVPSTERLYMDVDEIVHFLRRCHHSFRRYRRDGHLRGGW